MTDDIIARLRCSYADPPCEVCTFCAARAEIERLRAALAIASGMISTLPPYEDQHPESVMEMLLVEARRG